MPLPRTQRVSRPRQSKAASWAWLEQRLEEIDGERCADGEILNLPGWRAVSYKETDHDIIIFESLSSAVHVQTWPAPAGAFFTVLARLPFA